MTHKLNVKHTKSSSLLFVLNLMGMGSSSLVCDRKKICFVNVNYVIEIVGMITKNNFFGIHKLN